MGVEPKTVYSYSSSVRGFPCAVCGAAWATAGQLDRHRVAAHTIHECNRCHQLFTLQSRFRKHTCLKYPDSEEEEEREPPVPAREAAVAQPQTPEEDGGRQLGEGVQFPELSFDADDEWLNLILTPTITPSPVQDNTISSSGQ